MAQITWAHGIPFNCHDLQKHVLCSIFTINTYFPLVTSNLYSPFHITLHFWAVNWFFSNTLSVIDDIFEIHLLGNALISIFLLVNLCLISSNMVIMVLCLGPSIHELSDSHIIIYWVTHNQVRKICLTTYFFIYSNKFSTHPVPRLPNNYNSSLKCCSKVDLAYFQMRTKTSKKPTFI